MAHELSDSSEENVAESVEQINNYKLRRLIASGQYTSVFQATKLDEARRTYAIKIVRESHSVISKVFQCRELKFLRKASCPNIISPSSYHHKSLDDFIYHVYIMDFYHALNTMIDGLRRDQANSNATFLITERCAQQIMRQVNNALVYLHEHELLHTRLRSDYLLLDGQGIIKLTGLGRMSRIKLHERHVDTVENVLTGGIYDVKDETFYLGILCVELLIDLPVFNTNDLFDEQLSADGREKLQQTYQYIQDAEQLDWTVFHPSIDGRCHKYLRKIFTPACQRFLNYCIFTPKEDRFTCAKLAKSSWLSCEPDPGIIVHELLTQDETKLSELKVEGKNEANWNEQVEDNDKMTTFIDRFLQFSC
ncbi:unnamed protein product [Bursaphelenchus okinawaensis]|uniref:non-specific serine/threonine protein kinase n=1 Tax=Bursaphelenchus okinawaensis TaxID=465554 RepID=A0A811LKH6_9BILA|nr:unnamed protein product [Bursaphelenchus okinawaensis]CAG9124179.1 unnamed protein product [Bursaphelenchus okinawaensis]